MTPAKNELLDDLAINIGGHLRIEITARLNKQGSSENVNTAREIKNTKMEIQTSSPCQDGEGENTANRETQVTEEFEPGHGERGLGGPIHCRDSWKPKKQGGL